jgi:hypothetical protein
MFGSRALVRLALRFALLGVPLGASLIGYFVLDPFKVVRRHDVYYDAEPVSLNRDYVSTEELFRLAPTRPNAFVFGSSRSLAFRCDDWRPYLPASARPFHFDAWLETLYGVASKVRYLDSTGLAIDDALFIFDSQAFARTNNQYSHLFVKHPAVSGEPAVAFQTLFVGTFFANLFFVKYFDYELFRTLRPYMRDVFPPKPVRHLRETNDLIFSADEAELAAGEDAFYAKRAAVFAPRTPVTLPPFLQAKQLALIGEISALFAKHHTRVRVIVSPLYDQYALNPADRRALEHAFGAEHVFDFSGVNAWTADRRNYYEESHYRPHVARALMRAAYGPPR